MEEFRIYSVSDKYIEYLRNAVPNVYSNKENDLSAGYVKSALDYRALENLCRVFIRENEESIS